MLHPPLLTCGPCSPRAPVLLNKPFRRPARRHGDAASFSLESARILTRTLAGFAAAGVISPVAGLRTSVPALRAGTFRRLTLRRPGSVTPPSPRGYAEPRNALSIVR